MVSPLKPPHRPTPTGRDWRRPIVRILSADAGVPVGVGVRVGEREILTCAHVVVSALGLHSDRLFDERPPAGDLHLDFPHSGSATRRRVARVCAGGWFRDYRDRGEQEREPKRDIAIIEIERVLEDDEGGDPDPPLVPDDVWQAVFDEHQEDLPYKTWGVPKQGRDGDNARGEIHGYRMRGIVELGAERTEKGYAIDEGFSGGPVRVDDLDAMVGIVVAKRGYKADLIPTEVLAAAYPALGRTRRRGPARSGASANPREVARRLRSAAPMIDRGIQENEVRGRIRDLARLVSQPAVADAAPAPGMVLPRHPATFLVCGLEVDGVEEFKDKLSLQVLPGLFDRTSVDFAFQRIEGLDVELTQLDDLKERLENTLGAAPRDAAELRRLVNAHEKQFFCLHSVVSDREVKPSGVELIRRWLRLWHEAGEIETGFSKWVIVVVGISRTRTPPPRPTLLERWRGVKTGPRLIDELLASWGSPGAEGPDADPGRPRVLRKLGELERLDVSRWLDGPITSIDPALAEQVSYAILDLVDETLDSMFHFNQFSGLLTRQLPQALLGPEGDGR